LGSIFSIFGVPEILVSDNATQFTSRQFRNMCFARGIRHITTTPYYPQPSHVERFNRNLRAALIAYYHRDHSRWDENHNLCSIQLIMIPINQPLLV
jgi:transposase InsO family protein